MTLLIHILELRGLQIRMTTRVTLTVSGNPPLVMEVRINNKKIKHTITSHYSFGNVVRIYCHMNYLVQPRRHGCGCRIRRLYHCQEPRHNGDALQFRRPPTANTHLLCHQDAGARRSRNHEKRNSSDRDFRRRNDGWVRGWETVCGGRRGWAGWSGRLGE